MGLSYRPISEERTDVVHQQLWLLQRREMPASRHAGPMNDVVTRLGPRARCEADLLRENSDTRRYVDETHGSSRPCVPRLVVEAARGGNRLRHPVEGDGREHFVLRERALDVAGVVAPAVEVFDDPGGQPSGRVVQAVGKGLGLPALDMGVAALGCLPVKPLLRKRKKKRPLIKKYHLGRKKKEQREML